MKRVTNYLKVRRLRGRGRRVWVPMLALGVVVAFWLAPGVEGQSRRSHAKSQVGGWGRTSASGVRDLSALAAELRKHSFWVARAGLTTADIDRVASVLEDRSELFAAYQERQEDLADRAANLLGADAIDSAALLTLRDEARQLATEVVDESLVLLVRAVEELSPSQRAAVVQQWRTR